MTLYVSTRGSAEPRGFEGALLAGLAEDGGLFVPAAWPSLDRAVWRSLRPLDYPALSARLLAPFTEGCFSESELLAMARPVYGRFAHPAVAPLKQLGPDSWLLELFHGPTLAFKDFAMQLLAAMFDAVLERRGERVTIVAATSGDTGAAAVRAFAGKRRVAVAMLHPADRISAVQRRQMTTEPAANVLNIAVEGTFDDCQELVKKCFADAPFRARLRLSAVNSINWARVVAQAVYYVYAALRLGAPEREVAFVVPTGNFGNIYAGWVAARLGLPIAKLVCATNRNDILARFFATGTYERGAVVATSSPSMDIQVASNFERLVLFMENGNAAAVARRMAAFRETGRLTADAQAFAGLRRLFAGGSADAAETAAAIRDTLARTGELVDPHTAVGLHVAAGQPVPGIPVVTLATAHPAKFPDAVAAACGRRPALPAGMADLLDRPERYVRSAADRRQIQSLIEESLTHP